MIRWNLQQALAITTAFSLVVCVASLHGWFGGVMFLVAVSLAIVATLGTHLAYRCGPVVGCSVVVFVTGVGVLIAHSIAGGNVRDQSPRLMGGIVIGFVVWLLMVYLLRTQREAER